ncbi:MAG: hypothetical protein SWX82_08025 [Cyanobacteriota bacterium]|nr:hypothetical protein [Cyanobacteriota bacterium]
MEHKELGEALKQSLYNYEKILNILSDSSFRVLEVQSFIALGNREHRSWEQEI